MGCPSGLVDMAPQAASMPSLVRFRSLEPRLPARFTPVLMHGMASIPPTGAVKVTKARSSGRRSTALASAFAGTAAAAAAGLPAGHHGP